MSFHLVLCKHIYKYTKRKNTEISKTQQSDMLLLVYILLLLYISSSGCSKCKPGQYKDEGNCISCPKGTFQDESGKLNCWKCNDGYYSDVKGSTKCQPCPKGHWCDKNDKGKRPIPCPKGTQQHQSGKSFCWNCNEGYYSDQKGSLYCTACPKGNWCDKNDKGKAPVSCPKGTQQHQKAKSFCWNCNVGYYSDQEGSLYCTACPKGYWCDKNDKGKAPIPCPKGTQQHQSGKSFCWNCNEGYYSIKIGSLKCNACPTGHWCNKNDNGKAPIPCPKGTYQGRPGKSYCWNCNRGYYSTKIGSVQCKACPKGHWCDKNDKRKPPIPCPSGQYQNEFAKSFCWRCFDGFYSATTGATSCKRCPSGFFCSTNMKSMPPLPCGKGTYSPTGSTTCYNCPTNKYCPRPDIQPLAASNCKQMDCHEIRLMAKEALKSYQKSDTSTDTQNKKYIFNAKNDVHGFIEYKNNKIIVAFRGTASITNWVNNIKFLKDPYINCKKCNVHKGFYQSYKSIQKKVMLLVDVYRFANENADVIITGHSFGGALATLSAVELNQRGIKADLVTFGSPRVGDNNFAKYANQIIKGRSLRVTYKDDIVTVIPPQAIGFKHVGQEIHLTNKKTSYIVPNNIDVDYNRLNKNDHRIENYGNIEMSEG